MVNGTDAVSINGQRGQAQLSSGRYDGNLDTYVRQVFQQIGGQQQQLAPQSTQQTTINGLPVTYGAARVNTGQSTVDVVVVAYEFSDTQAFHFATITPAGQSSVFNSMFDSMRRINADEAAQVIPRRIDVVTAGASDTVQTLASRMAYGSAQVERFRVLNGLGSNSQLVPGERYKIIVRG
jgi:predicted Zn-dependent protease